MKTTEQNKEELKSNAALALTLVIVIGVAKWLVFAQGYAEPSQAAAENLPPLPPTVNQNQISGLIYEGYLK